jgi:hypothetical protein
MNARSRAFWTFQLIFWSIAGTALFVSGASQMPLDEALIRNVFLTIAGFMTSFFLAMAIDELRWLKLLRLRLSSYALAYVVALFCVVAINAISFELRGVDIRDITPGQWFSGAMNLGLVYAFWSELFIQQIYLVETGIKQDAPASITVEHRGREVVLESGDIEAIRAAGDYVEIDCGGITYLDRRTLRSLEAAFGDDDFVRVHRSTLVNRRHVGRIAPISKGRFQLTLTSGNVVTSSRGYRESVQSRLVTPGG